MSRKVIKTRETYQIGKGHGTNSDLPVIREHTPDDNPMMARFFAMMQGASRFFKMGKVKIILSRYEHGWHMSISHPERYPTWDEIAKARYELIPNEVTMAMILPPQEEFVNIHNFCFQLMEVEAGTDKAKYQLKAGGM
jgi:hypothetical protein